MGGRSPQWEIQTPHLITNKMHFEHVAERNLSLRLRWVSGTRRRVKIKQRPEDFVVREGYRFEEDPDGPVWVYRMDKQKVSTLQALERLSQEVGVRRRNLSVCGLKDKQGRTEQLVGVFGGALGEAEVVQSGDLRLKLISRAAQPLTSANITPNPFEATVPDLSQPQAGREPMSDGEAHRCGAG